MTADATNGYNRVTVGGGAALVIDKQEGSDLHALDARRLKEARKLSLILDLDHTLLHCSTDPAPEQLQQKLPDLHHISLCSAGRNPNHWIKLRPGLAQFLEACHGLFELTIYTHGTREYAWKVAQVIDPKGAYFGNRIVSRDDCPDLGSTKSLERLFPGGISMALILDDNESVWQVGASPHAGWMGSLPDN